jgi:hypothetical protein
LFLNEQGKLHEIERLSKTLEMTLMAFPRAISLSWQTLGTSIAAGSNQTELAGSSPINYTIVEQWVEGSCSLEALLRALAPRFICRSLRMAALRPHFARYSYFFGHLKVAVRLVTSAMRR